MGWVRVREWPEGKDSESGQGRESRISGEKMMGPRQEAAMVWGRSLSWASQNLDFCPLLVP